MRLAILVLLSNFLFGCFLPDRKPEVFISDMDYAEFDRQYSPDSSMMILTYGIDLGALGYGHAGSAVLKLLDTTKDLRSFTLPNALSGLQ